MPHFTYDDPWRLRETRLDLDALGVAESVLALSNGYVGVRGTLDEADPGHAPGTFMSGVYETHPLSYPEGGYGHPEEGEAMVSVADGTPIRLEVDGVPLDVRTTPPTSHERVLDLRAGTLDRELVVAVTGGPRVRVRSRRVVSLTDRSVSAIRYEVAALDRPARIVLRSGLVVDECPVEIDNGDPRVAEALDRPFEAVGFGRLVDCGGALVHTTRRSGITVAAAVGHDVVLDRADDGVEEPTGQEAQGTPVGGEPRVSTRVDDDRVTTTISADLEAGDRLVLTKYLAHVRADGSGDTTPETLRERALAALEGHRARGLDALLASQRDHLDRFWAECDVEVDGDDELQLALRYALFQLHGSAACTTGAPVGAKGLTGSGYSGHTFWDIEGFVLPALTLLRPDSAARLLRWRAGTLDQARDRARVLDLAGASFAWRTISGTEVSAYWPASTAAMHVNADIARAFDHWTNVTGEAPEAVGALGVLVETARLWASMASVDAAGEYHFYGMTGPDEYTGVVDDNVFTNLMAQRNLHVAAQTCADDPGAAAGLGVTESEIGEWHAISRAIHVPYDEDRRVHPANASFTQYREWPFEDKEDGYPVQENSHYALIYRRQVLKQADLVQALWWCRDAFTPEEAAADLEYYEARTVRDSSLSACVQAVACAEADHVDLALRYLREAAFVDLRDLHGNAAQGLHLASVAGAWLAFTAGLGGLREDHDTLELAPHLPAALSRTRYHVRWRGSVLRVETTRAGTTLSLPRPADRPVEVVIDRDRVLVGPDEPVRVPLLDPAPLRPEPTQPPGRAPSC
ncbi:glycoside hydrolase family 65 protein [Agilicoccus flavus]|uniref:glycoside hydrolase family 65 protein n=1 Tax=Agilicoccus flavus TaxID=2775968 RepID=UPI001CF713C8|nr:glycosyl hydrolase family 65 protein [Agilicoccus flavus]